MRVISGLYKGRNLLGHNLPFTRPTMDRVKESLFALIQDEIENSKVLDLFSGSGSLGIEALSRRCAFCFFVDNSKEAIDVIKKNLSNLGILNKSKVLYLDYKKALNKFNLENEKFDLVFLDPPYKDKIIANILDDLIDNDLLNDDALVACETSCKDFQYENDKYSLFKSKIYSDKAVFIYRKLKK